MLDNFGFDTASPLAAQNRPQTPGILFDAKHDMQKSKIRFSNLVGLSNHASANTTVTAGGVTNFGVKGAPNLAQNTPMTIHFFSLYEGTAASPAFQIYPTTGGSISGNKFYINSGGYDYVRWTADATFPAPDYFIISVYNSAGTTANLYFDVQSKFIANNVGSAA